MKESRAKELLSQVGKWHIQKTLLLGLVNTPMSWHYLSYPLWTFPKPYTCAESENVTADQCYFENGSPCQKWDFQSNDQSLTLQEDFGLVCIFEWLLSIKQTIFFLGMLVGCLITGNISDKYGRKPTMLVLMVIWCISALLHSLAPNYTTFLILQFILVNKQTFQKWRLFFNFFNFQAFAAQSSWTCSWIWTMEIYGTNDKYRVILGLSTLLFWAGAFMTAPGIVYLLPNWRHSFLFMSAPTLLFVFYIWIIPESPLWLINKGRFDEADAILKDVSETNGLFFNTSDDEKLTMADSENHVHESDDCESSACCSLVTMPRIRNRTMIISFMFFVGSFVYYGLSLNSSSVGGDNNRFITFTLYGAMEIPAILFAMLSLSCLGRRLPLFFEFLLAGLSCLAASLVQDDSARIALAVFGKLCITACFHGIFVYASELFATANRNTGVSICSVFARVAGMTAPFVGELKVIHSFLPIAVFGGCGVLAAILTTFLPETKGANLPDSIQESEEFGRGDTLWRKLICSSKKWVMTMKIVATRKDQLFF